MPTYQSICLKCEASHDYVRKIDDRNDTPACCGDKTTKLITAASVPCEYASSFISPIDGKPVHGREQFFAHMKKHDVIPYIPGCGKTAADAAKERDVGRKKAIIEALQTHGA